MRSVFSKFQRRFGALRKEDGSAPSMVDATGQEQPAHGSQALVGEIEDRRQIAQHLHEDLGQSLNTLRMSLVLLRQHEHLAAHDPELAARVIEMQRLAEHALHGLREAVQALRPPVLDWGLPTALRALAREYESSTRVPVTLWLDCDDHSFAPLQANVLYKLIEEAFSYIAHQVQARCLTVQLTRCDDSAHWLLRVSDGGGVLSAAQATLREPTAELRLKEFAELINGHCWMSRDAQQQGMISVRFPSTQVAPSP